MKTDWKAKSPWLVLTVLATSTGAVRAEDETERPGEPLADEMPDMEFLEYLGSWESSDEEWILFAGEDLPAEERDEPRPEERRGQRDEE